MITEFQDGFITKNKLNELVGGINALDSMTANETIYVGVGQTYVTLSSALDYAKNKKPNRDYKIEIIIKSGTVVSEQLIYENADFGHVIISSEDVEVNVDVSGFTIAKFGAQKPFFYLNNGNCPLINTILKGNDMFENSSPKYDSIGFVLNNSYLKINNSKGVYNFGYGIHANMSKIIAYNCNIKNIIVGMRCNNSDIIINGSNLSDFRLEGLVFQSCTVDMSSVNINSIYSNTKGCSASNCMLHGENVVCNASYGFIVGYGGTYHIGGGEITGNSEMGILLVSGGVVNANQTICTLSIAPNTITASGIIFK